MIVFRSLFLKIHSTKRNAICCKFCLYHWRQIQHQETLVQSFPTSVKSNASRYKNYRKTLDNDVEHYISFQLLHSTERNAICFTVNSIYITGDRFNNKKQWFKFFNTSAKSNVSRYKNIRFYKALDNYVKHYFLTPPLY